MLTSGNAFSRAGLAQPIRYGISNRNWIGSPPEQRQYFELLFSTSAQVIQVREKDLPDSSLAGIIDAGLTFARQQKKLLIVNSRVRLAAERGADGVHLTSDQAFEAALAVRSECGRPFLVGKSVHSMKEAVEAAAAGSDYLLLAPIYTPRSKASYLEPLGLDTLREICALVRVPVLALGGVGPEHAALLQAAGAAGFAGIDWVHREIEEWLQSRDQKPLPARPRSA